MPTERYKFQAMVFMPDPAQHRRQDVQVSEAESAEWLQLFDKVVRNPTGGFTLVLHATGDGRPLTVEFEQLTKTAAYFRLSYRIDGNVKHWHGVGAFLPRLNADDERVLMDHVKQYGFLKWLPVEQFDEALKPKTPALAMFFADMGSANYGLLHTVIRLLGHAYFGKFGIGSELDGPVGPMHA